MGRQAVAKKRRRGTKVTRKAPKHYRLKIRNSVVNDDIKQAYDKTKSPADNLKSMGLVANPNNMDKQPTPEEIKYPAFMGYAQVVGDTPKFQDPNPKLKIITPFDAEYVKKLMAKHGENCKAMERDIKLNDRQYTENQMAKLIKKYHKAIEAGQLHA
jgi:hypothetical protein